MNHQTPELTTVHFSTQETWHGGEGQAFHLIQGLRARGHRVIVAAREGGAFARAAQEDGFVVHTFRRRGRGLDSFMKIRGWLKEIRPHVIHSHDGHALTSSGLASLGLGIPLRVASRRVDFPIRSAAKFTRLADVVIAISHAVADVCVAGGIPQSMIRIVHSGVDPARARNGDRRRGRASVGLSDTEPLVLVVAKLTDHKGHTYLLDALPAILQRFPTLHVALAGSGELAESLLAQARLLEITDRVKFLGYRNDIPDLLMAADLFVMPSHMEGLCTSVLDAMFAQVPLVTTGAGGIADAVGLDLPEGPVAFFAPPKNAPALADAIVEALSSPDKAAELVERAYDRAKAKFANDCMVDGTLSVYQQLLAGRASRAA